MAEGLESNLWEIYLHAIACHCLSWPSLPFPTSFTSAGNRRRFVQLGFNLPVVSRGLKRPPRAGLPRLRMQGMQIWLQQQLDLEGKGQKNPDLKADPWSVGTNGSKIELPLFDRPDEGAGRA